MLVYSIGDTFRDFFISILVRRKYVKNVRMDINIEVLNVKEEIVF